MVKGKTRANDSPGYHIDLTLEDEVANKPQDFKSTDQDILAECLELYDQIESPKDMNSDDSYNEESDDPICLHEPTPKLKWVGSTRGQDNRTHNKTGHPPAQQKNFGNSLTSITRPMSVKLGRVQVYHPSGQLLTYDFSTSYPTCELTFASENSSYTLEMIAKKSQSGETFPFRIVGHEVEQAFIHRSRFGLAGILLQFRSHFKVYDRTKVWKSNELGGELQCKSLDRAPPIAACFLQAYDGSCLTDIESIAGSVGESCSKLSDENRRVFWSQRSLQF